MHEKYLPFDQSKVGNLSGECFSISSAEIVHVRRVNVSVLIPIIISNRKSVMIRRITISQTRELFHSYFARWTREEGGGNLGKMLSKCIHVIILMVY